MSLAQARNVVTHVPNQDPKARFNEDAPTISSKYDNTKEESRKKYEPVSDASNWEINIVSPHIREISDEEALSWLQIMPPELIGLIESLDVEENTIPSTCKEMTNNVKYTYYETQKGNVA